MSTQTGRHGRLCSQLPDCVTGLTVFFFLFNLQPENLQKNWLREFYQVRAGRQSAHVREQLRLLEARVRPAALLSSGGRGVPPAWGGRRGTPPGGGGASHFLVPPRRPLPSQMPPRLGLCLSAGTFMRTWVQDGGSEACVCPQVWAGCMVVTGAGLWLEAPGELPLPGPRGAPRLCSALSWMLGSALQRHQRALLLEPVVPGGWRAWDPRRGV